MASRTAVLWTLTNEFEQRITCTMEERDAGTFRIVIQLEEDEVVSELHYTPASAISRARALRDTLTDGRWEPLI